MLLYLSLHLYLNTFSLTRYELMLDCWKEEPDERPSFEQLIPKLEKMMTKDNPYFDWDGDNESDASNSETKPESDQLNE